jgi:plasmid maintenance system antidote protein VapI
VRGRRGISADTALRLARFFGTSHQFWLNLQANYDVQCAEDAAGTMIAKIKPRKAAGTTHDEMTARSNAALS